MTTITRARAAAILALGALALTACHPDDNLTPAEGKTVTISATAALPTAGMQASGATSRAASTSTQQSVNFDFDNNSTIPVTLNTYSGSSKKGYAYNFNKTTNANATSTAKLEPKSDDDALKAKSGSSIELGIDEMKLPLLLPIVRTLGGGSTATALVPFSARAKMKKQSFTVGTDGTLTKELTLAYTTTALRLRLVIADGVSPVAQVSCPLAMADGAEKESILIRTDGTDVPATTEQTVIFGELTPGTVLEPNGIAALLRLSDGKTPDGSTGTLLAVPWTPAVLAKINSQIPAAGQMITLTVHVSRTVASIVTDNITIGGFAEGNGATGEGIIAGYQGEDGTKGLSPDIYNADNPLWVVTGGGSSDATVQANVRAALNAMKDADGNVPDDAKGTIDLVLTGVMSLPMYSSKGAFLNCPQLRSVSLPAATSIGFGAFAYCTSLTTVSAPAATTINSNAFQNCSQLTSVSLPAAITIGLCSFKDCSQLTSVSLPAATTIGSYVFQGCSQFTSLSLPAATTIRSYVFSGCIRLTKLDISGITSSDGLAEEAFDNASGDSAFETDYCALVIGRTLYNSLSQTDKEAITSSKSFKGKTWASITIK